MGDRICIVILNWNQCGDTLACLESLSKVSYAPPIQIVVIDNGSEDDSVSSIRRNYPAVEVIEANRNVGCAAGRNMGLAYADSINFDFVLFLDNDTTVDPYFIRHLKSAADAEPNIGILTSKIVVNSNPSVCWTAGGSINADGTVEALHYYTPSSEVPDSTFYVNWVPGCVLFVRREVYKNIGEFDDSYSFYFEDIDFCVRASQQGYKVAVAPQSVVFHKVSQSLGGSDSPARLYYWSRNRLIFAQRQTRGFRKLATLALMVGEDIKDGFGDIMLMKQPRRALARWKGTLHFFLRRRGFRAL